MSESEIWISPLTKTNWEIRLLSNPLLWYAYSKNATKTLMKQLDYIVQTNGFLVCMVLGDPNSGKSEVADSIAFALQRRYLKNNVKASCYATFNLDETLTQITALIQTTEPNEKVIIVQDECPKLHGKGSRIAVDCMNNILMITRAREWSYLFTSPILDTSLNICHFMLETMAMDRTNRQNLCLLYSSNFTPLGKLWVPLINNSEWSAAKYTKKDENIEKLLKSGGFVGVRHGIYGTKVTPNASPYIGQIVDLRQAVYTQIQEYGISERDIDIFARWIQGESQRDIAPDYNLQQSGISEVISKIKLSILGYAFEDVYYHVKSQEEPNWEQGGKNTPDPDMWNTPSKSVLSLKCYADRKRSITIPFSALAQSELDLLNKGFTLSLIFYNILWNEIFTVPIQGDEKQFSFQKGV